MSIYKILMPVVLCFMLGSFTACNNKNKSATENEEVLPPDIVELREDQIKLAYITTGSIELQSLSGTLKVSGTITSAPQNTASVSVPMGGIVKSTGILPGKMVSKGQVLAVIENQDFIDIQQNYLETKAKLEYTGAEYNRQKELYKNDISSAKNMQLISSEYKSLKIQLKSLEQKLSLIGINSQRLTEENISRTVNLISPIAGYVKSANISIGKFVSATDVLFEIVGLDNMYIQLSLFEKDAAKVSENQKIRFFINNESEQHDAVIYQTAKSVDADKTYKVYAKITGTCKNVLPGMYVNAIIETTTNKVTAVPTEAIVSFDDKDYIFVVERNKVENGKNFTEYKMIQIQKGISDGGYTEITLPDNVDYKSVKLVVKGSYNLLSAMKNAGEMSC